MTTPPPRGSKVARRAGQVRAATVISSPTDPRSSHEHDPGYDDARTPWNTAVEQRPAEVVTADGTVVHTDAEHHPGVFRLEAGGAASCPT
jgi:hypothetical protein